MRKFDHDLTLALRHGSTRDGLDLSPPLQESFDGFIPVRVVLRAVWSLPRYADLGLEAIEEAIDTAEGRLVVTLVGHELRIAATWGHSIG
jgi:hypothetical protein